jgi:hypothetical protein
LDGPLPDVLAGLLPMDLALVGLLARPVEGPL